MYYVCMYINDVLCVCVCVLRFLIDCLLLFRYNQKLFLTMECFIILICLNVLLHFEYINN